MSKAYFYPQSTYTSIVAFSELFNDLTVRVFDSNNNIIGVKPVPLTLTPKEKIAAILASTNVNDVDPQVDNYLPRISINMSGLTFDAIRARGKFEKRLLNIDYDLDNKKRTMQIDVQPVPYSISFEVTIWTKYMIDGIQLIEYLLPWFAPEQYVSYKERNFGLEHKSRVILNSVSPNFVYELGETERRVITWTLGFNMETIMFRPMEIAPEILCSIISIANVPCRRIPFQGEKIIAYEPITSEYESILTKNTNVSIHALDASEEYDKMVKYWKHANEVMSPPYNESCVTKDCGITVGPKPEWDSSLTVTPCNPILMKPCVSIDPSGNIINYWQDQITGPDNIIRIVSYKRVYDSVGNTISGPDIIQNDEYPINCPPVYTAPITSAPITSVPITSEPYVPPVEPPIEIPDPCVIPPEYTTKG